MTSCSLPCTSVYMQRSLTDPFIHRSSCFSSTGDGVMSICICVHEVVTSVAIQHIFCLTLDRCVFVRLPVNCQLSNPLSLLSMYNSQIMSSSALLIYMIDAITVLESIPLNSVHSLHTTHPRVWIVRFDQFW